MPLLSSWWDRAPRIALGLALSVAMCPVRANDAPTVQRGKQLYTSYCARCHGVNMVTTGAAFDLRGFSLDQQERFERSVNQGLRAMPAWGSVLQPGDVQSLWLYVVEGR